MKHEIEVAFYRDSGRFLDRVIRWWTNSQFSHCEIVLSRNGNEAVLFSASARDGGVRKVTRNLLPDRWDIITVGRVNRQDLDRLIIEEAGAGYDYLGLFGSQFFASGWQSRKRWFCSEICAEVLGLPDPQRYSPESLRRLLLFLNGRAS